MPSCHSILSPSPFSRIVPMLFCPCLGVHAHAHAHVQIRRASELQEQLERIKSTRAEKEMMLREQLEEYRRLYAEEVRQTAQGRS